MNVSTTRLICSAASGAGHHASAISSSEEYYVVGAVVFLIRVIIQFIVITKGPKRVAKSRRASRSTQPGSRMAIDADLNAG